MSKIGQAKSATRHFLQVKLERIAIEECKRRNKLQIALPRSADFYLSAKRFTKLLLQ